MRLSRIGYQRISTSAFIPLMFSTIFFCSCATAPVSITRNPLTVKSLDPKSPILVIKPFIRFERMEDESALPVPPSASDTIERSLAIAALHEVESRHLTPIDYRGLEDDNLLAMCDRLQSMSPQLCSGLVDDQADYALKHLAVLMEHPTVLVLYLKVKVGSSGSWNPYSGAITSPNSSSHFQASLIGSDMGEVLWQNQVLLREVPRVDNSNFRESLGLLFKTFPNSEE
jgi:hypothetical protein